ncbi:sodium:calcium antiporter [Candidatus Margulisiibacteriota bacterium]
MLPLTKFIICAFLIYFAGSRLSKYGDIIAEKSGLGHAWIGLVLLAAITSLPELVNGISAVAFVGEPDFAVGNILGACLINMAVIGGLDLYQYSRKKEMVFSVINSSNRLIVYIGSLMVLVFIVGVFYSQKFIDISLAGVGIFTLLIFLTYLIAQKLIFEKAKNNRNTGLQAKQNVVQQIYIKFLSLALLVIACGIWLPYIGDEMALVYGLGNSFVGVFFLGIATTLPELVVSSTALKYSVDMSVGNLLGSNIFNLSLLFIFDIFYRKGSLFSQVSFGQFVISCFLLFSFLLVIYAAKAKTKNRVVSFGLIFSYIIGIFCLYLVK